MTTDPSIGVVDLAMSGWTAGSVVSRTMACSLHAIGANIAFFGPSLENAEGLRLQAPAGIRHFPGEYSLRRVLSLPLRDSIAATARQARSDIILPLIKPVRGGFHKVGWIPDFQHKHLPDLYSAAQLKELDDRFEAIASTSDRVLLSSEDAAKDFRHFHARHARKAAVASFPSTFVFQSLPTASCDVLDKYHLPSRFALVVNQFWKHKNHKVVARALGILSRKGIAIPVVMIGQPSDFRDKQNQILSDLLQTIVAEGIWSHCCLLGHVSRTDLLGLLRSATMLIQPSLFEGWNTSVQDAKALGCPVLASHLAVHHEQLGGKGRFFDPHDAGDLAACLETAWAELPARPDPGEHISLQAEHEFALLYGRKLRAICQEACCA